MIRIEGRYALEDYIQVVTLREWREWLTRIPLLIAGGLTLFLAAAAIVTSTGVGGSRYVELTFVIWLALIALWRFAIRPLGLYVEFAKLKLLYAPFTCEVNEQGISFQNEYITEMIRWYTIAEWRETRQCFVLDCVAAPHFTTRTRSQPFSFSLNRFSYYAALGYRVLPKRLFEDEAAAIQFRELLVANQISRRGIGVRVLALIALNSLVVGVVVAIIVGLIVLAVRR